MPLRTHLPLILATATLFLACSSSPPEGTADTGEAPGQEARVPADDELTGDWTLVAMGDVTEFAAEITLGFNLEEGKISGRSACNRYFAPWAAEGGVVEIGMAGSTMMACPDPVMELEQSYFGALETVAGYRMVGDDLELTDDGGDAVLRFSRAEQ